MKMKITLVAVVICVNILISKIHAARLQEKYVWKSLPFAWPSIRMEQEAIASGRYIPENNMPLGMELWKDKVFITVPRWKSGVVSSLNYIQLPTDERSPLIHPYPNWEAHDIEAATNAIHVNKRATGCNNDEEIYRRSSNISNSMISPFRVRADEADRLWVLDSGIDGFAKKSKTAITPPTIIIFDLNTDSVIHRYSFPYDQVLKESSFPYITIDITDGDVDNAFAYITDVTGFGLIVYSLKQDKSWRIKHNFFHLDPLEGNFYTGPLNYQLPDGIFGMTIGNLKPDQTKDVYFHPLSSTKEFIVSNKVLQNESHVTGKNAYYDFKLLGTRGANGQSTAEVFDSETEIIFYSQVNKDAVGCWNSNKPYTPDFQGLVDSDSNLLVFVNELFIDREHNLWVLSNQLSRFFFDKQGLNPNNENFRILGGSIVDLIKGTPCDDTLYLTSYWQ